MGKAGYNLIHPNRDQLFIVDAEVTPEENDEGQLHPMLAATPNELKVAEPVGVFMTRAAFRLGAITLLGFVERCSPRSIHSCERPLVSPDERSGYGDSKPVGDVFKETRMNVPFRLQTSGICRSRENEEFKSCGPVVDLVTLVRNGGGIVTVL